MTTQDTTPRGTSITFKDVTKVFQHKKGSVTAVDNVNLEVKPGEIIGIIGYSGAGKSTLVRLINGLDTVTSGHIYLDGTDIVGMPEKQMRTMRRKIGMIFQQFNLFSSRTAAGNVEYPLKLAGVPKQERAQRVQQLLDFVGLGDRGSSYPEQLSGGQKQRVGIARALATTPSLLLADEATSALDPETTHEVLRLLRKVNRELGITIVVITHEMDVIRSIADNVAVMENGKVVEYGSVYEIFSNPQTPIAKHFVSTSLRNTPDELEEDQLLGQEGRLFTIKLTEKSGFFSAAANARNNGVYFSIVHGGVTTIQNQSFGNMTVRLLGEDSAIQQFYNEVAATTDIKEIVR
ncbi:methionine ABC transporter ATP-binding protein [Actinotignum urinale]|uniref:Methionine ABC transporter ATP-binding protein n=1 Tax=Actinotignum urinale TaxID=190146 RepID=A0AAW9HMS3_9ACTO|nr:methionine ABC transporter ATP-binding protein [Actinotignum urinale]MDY5128452.1 methionine ABC transporter ATP-binding protein [Actinotignum urinale]MDY5155181.1 methionine ABC transporter ATP-binding protein [Actinotignum urinale]MDY5160533.1 methionine ABC transporter ATP-binding protein [Actinotignum urinale]